MPPSTRRAQRWASTAAFRSAAGAASRDTATDALVVVELRRGQPSDRVVGQAARYMGWVRAHIAREGQPVEGLIIASEQGDQLAYAVSAVPNLAVLTYAIDFVLTVPRQPKG